MADLSELFANLMVQLQRSNQPDIFGNRLGMGMSAAEALAFVDSLKNYITQSATLSRQLENLQTYGWSVELPLNPPTTGNLATGVVTLTDQKIIQVQLHSPEEQIKANNISSGIAQEDYFNALSTYIGELAREVGHAENANVTKHTYLIHEPSTVLDPIAFLQESLLENGLSIGAQMASFFLSEGKAVYNNIVVAKEILVSSGSVLPVFGIRTAVQKELDSYSNSANAIIDGAVSYYYQRTSTDKKLFIVDYWNIAVDEFKKNNPVLANKNILDQLEKLDMSKVLGTNGFHLTQNINTNPGLNTITMTVNFDSNSLISSYINTFGGYGAIMPSDDVSGDVDQHIVSPSPAGVVTGQTFNYRDGSSLVNFFNAGVGVNSKHPLESYYEAIRRFDSMGALTYAQYNQVDDNHNVIRTDFIGKGAEAILRNVANVELEEGAEVTIYGTNNTITLNGNNILKISAAVEGLGQNTNNIIKNFGAGDAVEFIGVKDVTGAVLDPNGLLTVHAAAGDVSVQLEPSPYLRLLNLSLQANGDTAKISAAMKAGFHIVQANETAASIAASVGLSADVLTKINSVFDDADFSVGGVVRVPLSTGNANNLAPLPTGRTYVYNPNSNVAFVVPSRLDGQHDGALIIDPTINSPVFQRGTFSSVSANDNIFSIKKAA